MPGADRKEKEMSKIPLLVPEIVNEEGLKIHEKSIEAVCAELQTDLSQGLSSAEAERRFLEDGPNELEQPPRISLWMLFIIQLNTVIMYLLMAAVVASAAIRATGKDNDKFISYVDSIAITIIVLINATIAAVTENNANDALAALSSLQTPESTVIRDGKEIQIKSREMVTGDIVKLGTGDVVPADVRCIKADDFRVNEMLLTGEPEDVAKSTKVKIRHPGQAEKLTADNMAFSSCQVKSGSAVGLVVACAMKTRVGGIAALLNDSGNDDDGPADIESGKAAPKKKKTGPCGLPDTKAGWSPLQVNLEALAVKLGYMAIGVCLVVFIVGFLMGTKDPESPETPSWLFMVLVAVTLTVAAIPEGLPLCVTISLSSGCSSMVQENVLMRKIAAVETLGSASIICTDKTGTLTEGKMTLIKMHVGGTDYDIGGKGFDPTTGKITRAENGSDASGDGGVRATLGSAILCSNTTLSQEADPDTGVMKWAPRGNSSEAPLVVAAAKIGLKLEALEKFLARVYEIPFSSSRKMMLTITETAKQTELGHVAQNGHTAHVKGAPNYIMNECTSYMTADGTVMPLDAETKKKFMDKVDELSEQALRVLAIACNHLGKELPFDSEEETDAKFGKVLGATCTLTGRVGLTLCGLCASIDPERDGVKDAVLQSKTAGVRVVMITGDYLKTAIAIAKNINILNPRTFVEGNGEATDCGVLRPVRDSEYLSHADFDKITRTTSVFARAKPEDKLEIVKSLQRQGWVCAMTGDGVNDAPALQRADIGVAMGLEGTEVAKGASDMILTDDNFCSIVKAIEKGRIIYAGIQKFVSFIMSVHFAEVLQIFLCIVTSVPVMRQPLQILFLILVTDLPPSIALGFEPGEALTMKRAPRPKTQPVVLAWMWRGIVANGIILTICIFSTYMIALSAYAGAFRTDSITGGLYGNNREHCTIWGRNDWAPTLDFTCSVPSNILKDPECDPLTEDCEYLSQRIVNEIPVDATQEQLDRLYFVTPPPGAEEGEIDQFLAGIEGCKQCIDTSIRRARTTSFISLVWAEGFRAYCSRSFDNFVWVNTFNNPSMNKAVAMAQVTLVLALFTPGLNTVLGLYPYEIHFFGVFLAFAGAFSCLVGCELFKYFGKQFIEETKLANYTENADGTVNK